MPQKISISFSICAGYGNKNNCIVTIVIKKSNGRLTYFDGATMSVSDETTEGAYTSKASEVVSLVGPTSIL